MGITIYPILNPVLFEFGNISVRWYGIVLSLAIFTGVFLCFILLKKMYSKDTALYFIDIIPYVILFSIAGARIFYVIGNWNFYKLYPNEILLINHGGISIWGAIIFGIAGIVFFVDKKKLDRTKLIDILAVVFPLSQSIGRWGNYFNQEAYGKASDGFIKLYVEPAFRLTQYKDTSFFHPTFLYESCLDLFLFIGLFCIFLKFKNLKKGTIALLYIIFYSIIRIIVESFRIDSISYIFHIPIATVISIFALVCAVCILIFIYTKKDAEQ